MLVSVIIPIYNSEATIFRCVESVVISLERVTTDYEIICIDDGSQDNSLKVLNELHENIPNLVIITQENAGAAAARNRGLEIAKGDFIAFNDSDDEWVPDHFAILKKAFDDNPDLLCIAGNHDIDKQRIPVLKRLNNEVLKITLKDELVKNYYSPQATMFKKEIVACGIRFKQGMRYAEEGYFFYQIVHKYGCGFINKQVSKSLTGKARFGDGGLSGNLREMEKGELHNLKFAYKKLGINLFLYSITVILSYIKYFRRIIITRIKFGK